MQKQHVTPHEVLALAEIMQGINRGARITVAVDGDVTRLIEGTMRHLTSVHGSAVHANWNDNIWEMSVRVSATFEHWFTVRELVKGLATGTVAIER